VCLFFLLCHLLLELFNSSHCIKYFLLPRIERVTGRADLHLNGVFGRADVKTGSAGAAYFGIIMISWVYFFFHNGGIIAKNEDTSRELDIIQIKCYISACVNIIDGEIKMEETTKNDTKEEKMSSKKEEMARCGLHFGQAVAKRHPKMDPYIEGVKGAVHVIDLNKTEEKLEECLEYIKTLKKEGKTMLFVSTKPEFRKLVESTAKECNMPYVVNRFLGGMLTNFGTIKKRIDYYNDLLEKQESGELERKYTKHERVRFAKEMEGLEKNFGGVRNMERLPDAIFVTDMDKDKLAVKEARMKGITVVGIADTNVDPSAADYFIPANDDSLSSVTYILEEVKKILA